MKKYGKGWHGESRRHSLASRGIRTGRRVNYSILDKELPISKKTTKRGLEVGSATAGGAIFGSALGVVGAGVGALAGYGGAKAMEAIDSAIQRHREKKLQKEADEALKGSEDYLYMKDKQFVGRIDQAKDSKPSPKYIISHAHGHMKSSITKEHVKEFSKKDIPIVMAGYTLGMERRLSHKGYTVKERNKIIKAIEPKLEKHLHSLV